jgi:predicted 3-demethylubiquinone-9 3-methyltransferase (glyoxalase superfamily)/uncharacterized protein YndB with AHSA1/START domain
LVLEIERTIGAPRDAVWRCWTETALLRQWFCPKPWTVTKADFDLRPGGRMNNVMQGPDGTEVASEGMWLEIEHGCKLTFTDAFTEGFVPAESTFMTGYVELADEPDGSTRLVWGARHATVDIKQKHLEMGFEKGWSIASDQLEEVAKSIADHPETQNAARPFTSKVRTCLWFDGNGHEAARFYVSLLPDSFVETVIEPGDAPLVVEFRLAGVPYMALNGGPQFPHSPAASISVLTKDQVETDTLWDQLITGGGEESMCGWLTDRWGVSWQIIPEVLPRLLMSKDKTAAGRAQQAMLRMKKIDIATLMTAYDRE